MTEAEEYSSFPPAEIKKIKELFQAAFKDRIPIYLNSETVYVTDPSVYTRSGKASKRDTGTEALLLTLPEYRYNSASRCFKGTQEMYQGVGDTLAEEGVAKRNSIVSKQHALAGIGLYDEDPQPTRVIPIILTTNDMGRLEGALQKASGKVATKLEEVERARTLLSESITPGFTSFKSSDHELSGYLIAFSPKTDYYNGQFCMTQESYKQRQQLEKLEKQGAISVEPYGHDFIISLHDLEKLETRAPNLPDLLRVGFRR